MRGAHRHDESFSRCHEKMRRSKESPFGRGGAADAPDRIAHAKSVQEIERANAGVAKHSTRLETRTSPIGMDLHVSRLFL